jgi:hypothetical protein
MWPSGQAVNKKNAAARQSFAAPQARAHAHRRLPRVPGGPGHARRAAGTRLQRVARRLFQQAARLAPQLALGVDHAHRGHHRALVAVGLRRRFQPWQPVHADAGHGRRPGPAPPAARSSARQFEPVPEGAQPAATHRRRPAAARRAARRAPPRRGRAGRRHRTGCHSAAQLLHVVRVSSASMASERSRPCAAVRVKTPGGWPAGAPCAGPPAAALQAAACSFRRRPGCGAPRRAARRPASPARGGIAVFQRPFGRQQPGAVVHAVFRRGAAAAPVQQFRRAACGPAGGAGCRRPAGGPACGTRSSPCSPASRAGWPGALRGLVGTAIAGAKVLGQGLAQRGLGRTLAPQRAPLAGALGQRQQGVEWPAPPSISSSRCPAAAARRGSATGRCASPPSRC